MKRLSAALLILIAAATASYAQDAKLATNVSFSQQGDAVRIDYILKAPAKVSLYFSTDGGASFSGPMNKVTGDVGIVPEAGTKSILWDILSEHGPVSSSNVVFLVLTQALTQKEIKTAKNFFFGTGTSTATGSTASHDIRPGMKYSQYAKYYSTKGYVSQPGDKYNPTIAGACSALFPGIGQMIDKEVGRGMLFMFTSLTFSIVGGIALGIGIEDEEDDLIGVGTMSLLIGTGYRIWSICDAYKVAKKKNLYLRDVKAQYGADVSFAPSLQYAHTASGLSAAPGLSLRVTF